LNLIFQGALALSHASGDTAPFTLAKETVSLLLENAASLQKAASSSKKAVAST
jgi:hypothetical protein